MCRGGVWQGYEESGKAMNLNECMCQAIQRQSGQKAELKSGDKALAHDQSMLNTRMYCTGGAILKQAN